ncbi:hypothetical protein SAY87_015605 [Trapa incisa]|uniref:Transcription factor CBF/NF-Y/archaeal histone domain-containing protein n=1 Tax=Trapa incisa TaxID=236973 RepID=A0AAN7L7Q7_9MYRT|nr:hypothetical protein SAY87_015605 [Trapa incisa]
MVVGVISFKDPSTSTWLSDMKTTRRKDKSKGSMGTPKTPNNNRCKDAQDRKEEEEKKKKGNENGKSIKINGNSEKREQLIEPSSSSRLQGWEEKSKNGSSKRVDASNGDHSSFRKKQKWKKEEEEEGEDESKLNAIPMSRVQRIVKSEGSDLRINQEAYFLINKATEKFIEQFCEDAFTSAAARDRKRFLKYSHLSSVVSKERRYDFLLDFVPEKVKAEDALKEIKREDT